MEKMAGQLVVESVFYYEKTPQLLYIKKRGALKPSHAIVGNVH